MDDLTGGLKEEVKEEEKKEINLGSFREIDTSLLSTESLMRQAQKVELKTLEENKKQTKILTDISKNKLQLGLAQ